MYDTDDPCDISSLPLHIRESIDALDRTADRSSRGADEGPTVWLQDEVEDKYAFKGAVEIDCESRIGLCGAACCRLRFPLSEQDVREGEVEWDPDEPYLIATGPDGRCRHLEQTSRGCSVYDRRPAPCRMFDCRADRRIWIDFEARVPNPDLGRPEWPWVPVPEEAVKEE